MAKIMTLDELRDALTGAKNAMEETEAAIQAAGGSASEETVTDLEQRFDTEIEDVKRLSAAVERQERMADAYKAIPRPEQDPTPEPRVRVGAEPFTYRRWNEYRTGQEVPMFFRDILLATKDGDPGAQTRLQRHTREMEVESRAVSSGTGTGGGFVPPQYLQSEWAALARAGRPFADAVRSIPLPSYGVAFNIPRVTTGSTVAVQAGEAGAVADTSIADTELALTMTTIAGKTDLSRQAFERSQPGLDEIIGMDLAADYARLVDAQCVNGTGANNQTGILQASGTNSVTFTSPVTVAGFYPKLSDAIQRIHTARYMAPNLVVMHPRRWAWLLSALDSQGRPLIVPSAQVPTNAMAEFSRVAPQALVGSIQGLPVMVDANIPTLNGASTTEDAVFVTRTDDNLLMESGTPTVKVYEEIVSGNLQVRIQVYGYICYTALRYAAAHSKITGAGLVAPTF
jgi:HK97 family phage major capsid protein